MLQKPRQKEILTMLNTNGYVEISSLCKIFNVTEMTIRRDLDALAENSDIERTRGGAIISEKMLYFEPRLERRMDLNSLYKTAIASKALTLIENGSTIYFDSGSTVFSLVQSLPNDLHILAITNALNIGSELAQRTNLSAIMIGGEISNSTFACRGILSEEMMKQFRIDIAFIGANSIELDGQIYTANVSETGLKKAVIKAAKETYLLADSTKLNSTKIITYANLKTLAGLITDDAVSTAHLNQLRENGVNVIVADTE